MRSEKEIDAAKIYHRKKLWRGKLYHISVILNLY